MRRKIMPNCDKSGRFPQTSRRAFLRGLTSTSIALPFLPALCSSPKEAGAAELTPGQIQVTNPSFSRAERDRRWAAIRRIMPKPQWNLDAILAPASSDQAYPRYLTQIGGRGGSADVIFPRDDPQPDHAIVSTARNQTFWEKRLDVWRSDGKLILSQGESSKSV